MKYILVIFALCVGCDPKKETTTDATCAEWAVEQARTIAVERLDETLLLSLISACERDVAAEHPPCVKRDTNDRCVRRVGVLPNPEPDVVEAEKQ